MIWRYHLIKAMITKWFLLAITLKYIVNHKDHRKELLNNKNSIFTSNINKYNNESSGLGIYS